MAKKNYESVIISPEKPKAEQPSEVVETKVEHVEYTSEQKERAIAKAEKAVIAAEKATEKAEKPAPVNTEKDNGRPMVADLAARVFRRKQSLQVVQRRLKPTSRALSKVVHQPLVRAVSETGAKTAARPSGLFGGGVMAFVGSLVYLYLAKHVGFNYNYFVFTLFFLGGFVIGLLIELLLWAVRPRRASS